ncbi:MAG: tellurite resistance TerB family protein [Pirellula sp.]|jgi:hypothetical protein|nr:tellurite resistance TerB family protein [Pirellula sp.]
MSPFDILGEILNAGAGGRPGGRGGNPGGGSNRGGGNVDILKDILMGGGPKGSGSQDGIQFPGVFREGPSGGNGRPSAKELEEMLGVGRSSPSQPPARSPSPPARSPAPPSGGGYTAPSPRGGGIGAGSPQGDIFGQEPTTPAPKEASPSEEEQVIVLIRAMIHAGKADGRIDAQEQQAILERIGNTNPETIKFLRQEFANATTARDFAWTVPIGMETSVYAASIASISIDQQSEIDYLKELAQGLRLPPKLCNQIHQQYGIRPIF